MKRMRKGMAALLCAALFVGLPPTVASAAGIPEGTPAFALNETVVAFGGREWYVIGDSSNGVYPQSGHITLLAKSSFGRTAFRNGSPFNDHPGWTQAFTGSWWYEGSFILPNDYNDSTLMHVMAAAADALPSKEAVLITPRSLNDIGGTAVNNQKLWPLSQSEHHSMGSISGDPFPHSFWLRSPFSLINADVGVPYDGDYSNAPVAGPLSTAALVRPAFQLNLSSVLFTSDASGANKKSSATVGSGLIGAAAPGGAIKFTMRDDVNLSLTCLDTATRSVCVGDTVNIDYSGAQTGENNYISCVIVDSGGNIVRYGKLGTAASGTVGFMVPLLAEGSYTIKIFNEECNGDTSTDFASTPIAISMTVINSGADDPGIRLRNNGTAIQWRYAGEGDDDWRDLVTLSSLAGADGQDGADGREVELRVDGDYLQWRYTGGSWTNLMAVSVVTGPQGEQGPAGSQGPQGAQGPAGAAGANGSDGADGSNGADGRDGSVGADGLNGKDGANGADGANGKDGQDGARGKDGNGILSIAKTGSEGNVDTYTISFTDGTSSTFTITNGKDGVGVASAAWSENGELVFTFTDGTQINLGPLPGAAVPASGTVSGDKGTSDAAVPVAAGAASGAVASGLLYWLLPLLRKKIRL